MNPNFQVTCAGGAIVIDHVIDQMPGALSTELGGVAIVKKLARYLKRKIFVNRSKSQFRDVNWQSRLDYLFLNQGIILNELNKNKTSTDIRDYEFKVYSQMGEDGIIQKLVETVPMANKTFIEFGVEDFTESNCRFLMMKDNWAGFVIDGSQENVQSIRSAYYYWRYELTAECAFITKDNIDGLLSKSGFDRDLGILSIDVDGIDYFVLESISSFQPRILILEFNPLFGMERPITVPYDENFVRTAQHFSNLYFGASLAALSQLATKKGYALVGTNKSATNAFFVRRELMTDALTELSASDAFSWPTIRQSRDAQGRLTFLNVRESTELLAGLPVLNVETGEIETL